MASIGLTFWDENGILAMAKDNNIQLENKNGIYYTKPDTFVFEEKIGAGLEYSHYMGVYRLCFATDNKHQEISDELIARIKKIRDKYGGEMSIWPGC